VINNTLLGEMIPDQSTMEDRFMVERSKEEDQIKNIISTKGKMGSFLFMRNSIINDVQDDENDNNNVLEGEQTSQQSKSKRGANSIASKITPYILLIALGLHSFFEGLALGLGDTIGRTLVMLGAILVHKWAESLSLGISFVRAKTDKTNFIAMSIVFGIISPLGVVIGWVLSESNYEIIQGIFLALSTGTFLYVACTEVIVEEFSVGGYRVIKFILYMLAAFFIGGLTVAEHFFEQSKNEDHE
jgi:zinc transporter 1/2/3